MAYVLIRYLHLLAALVFAVALLIENMAIKPVINREDAHNLARIDAICGMAALVIIACGMTLWLWVGKPADFYNTNPVFHLKLGLLAILIVSAIYPAIFFFRHRQTEQEQLAVPKPLRFLLRFEIILLLIIPLLAWVMARGIGISG
jgi:putative membrane protein